MKLREFLFSMVKNPVSGEVSKTDFFSVVAYSVATGFFAWKNIAEPFNAELWIIYLGVVGGHNVLNKIVATRRDATSVTISSESASPKSPDV